MCLNQILKNEQVALMRHAAAADIGVIRAHRQHLNMFERLLALHHYAHRPYAPVRELEYGTVLEAAKSQKRSNREIRKPKADKPKAAPIVPVHPVNDLMKKPQTKR
jgi:hypothetical protein